MGLLQEDQGNRRPMKLLKEHLGIIRGVSCLLEKHRCDALGAIRGTPRS
jgi:hypothetical protein